MTEVYNWQQRIHARWRHCCACHRGTVEEATISGTISRRVTLKNKIKRSDRSGSAVIDFHIPHA